MWKRYARDLARIRPEARRFLLGSCLMGGAHAVPWTLLSLYLDRLGWSKAAVGSVQAAEAWGQVLVAVPAAFLLARLRTPPLLVLSCLATALGFALLPWIPSLSLMRGAKVWIGASWYLHYVAIAPFLHRNSGPEERPTLFGLADAVHTLAGVLGAFAAGRAVAFWVGQGALEVDALARTLAWSALLPLCAAGAYARMREGAPLGGARPRFWPVLARHRGLVLRFVVPHGITAIGAGLCVPFFGLYFQDRFARTPAQIGDLFAAWQALATLGFLASPLLVHRFGFVGGMLVVKLAAIPFFLTLAFTEHLGLAVLAYLLRGALMNTAGPIHKNLMMEASPDGLREIQVGLNSTVWGLGWVVGPWLGGYVLDHTGDSYRTLMLATVCLYATSAVATYALLGPLDPRRARAASLDPRAESSPIEPGPIEPL